MISQGLTIWLSYEIPSEAMASYELQQFYFTLWQIHVKLCKTVYFFFG